MVELSPECRNARPSGIDPACFPGLSGDVNGKGDRLEATRHAATDLELRDRDVLRQQRERLFRYAEILLGGERNNGAALSVFGKPVMPPMREVPVIRQLDLAKRRLGEFRLQVDRRSLCDMAMENHDCRPVPELAASPGKSALELLATLTRVNQILKVVRQRVAPWGGVLERSREQDGGRKKRIGCQKPVLDRRQVEFVKGRAANGGCSRCERRAGAGAEKAKATRRALGDCVKTTEDIGIAASGTQEENAQIAEMNRG